MIIQCAWCKRIRVTHKPDVMPTDDCGGFELWATPDDPDSSTPDISHAMCPECKVKVLASDTKASA